MKLTLVGWMAVAGFVISLILLVYTLNKESRQRDEGGTGSRPPQIR
jgi:hypothetical protein